MLPDLNLLWYQKRGERVRERESYSETQRQLDMVSVQTQTGSELPNLLTCTTFHSNNLQNSSTPNAWFFNKKNDFFKIKINTSDHREQVPSCPHNRSTSTDPSYLSFSTKQHSANHNSDANKSPQKHTLLTDPLPLFYLPTHLRLGPLRTFLVPWRPLPC
jgi:hypothetical protein